MKIKKKINTEGLPLAAFLHTKAFKMPAFCFFEQAADIFLTVIMRFKQGNVYSASSTALIINAGVV